MHSKVCTGIWRKTLSAIQLETPDKALNLVSNGWLLYQTIACRLWRAVAFISQVALMVSGDQLQDVLAVLYTDAGLARAQIIRSASRQFKEGDVQHLGILRSAAA